MEHDDDLEINLSPAPGSETAQLAAALATGLDHLATILEHGLRDLRLVMGSAAACERIPYTTGNTEPPSELPLERRESSPPTR